MHWRLVCLTGWALFMLEAAGCELPVPPSGPAAAPQASGAPASTASAPEAASPTPQAASPASQTGAAAASAPGAAAVAPTPAPGGGTLVVTLSRGVALAQTGAEGTMMGFSVEYRVSGGTADPQKKYFWLIKPAQGKPASTEISLKPQGSLEGFFPQFRPENGPFEGCVLQRDSQGKESQVSAFIALQ